MKFTISKEMQQMVDTAKNKGLWIHCEYQDLWFEPKDLEECWKSGLFCWGATNWSLRPVTERVIQLERKVRQAEDELKEFKKRIK